MNVSITVPCRNEELYIGKCLESITRLNYPKENLQVFVVDGNSTDSTRDIVLKYSKDYPWITLLNNSRQFTPFALNIGLKANDADVKIIVGAHSELDVNYVKESVTILEDHPEVGCAGGLIKNTYANRVAETIGMAMSSPFGVGNATFRTGGKDGYVDTVAFGAYRKHVFEKIGYFDEELVRNQDDEFNFRMIKNGFKIWFSKSIVSHYYVRGSYLKLFRQYYQYGYWKVFVNKKHSAVTSVRQLIPFFFVLYLCFSLVILFFPKVFLVLYLLGLLMYVLGALFFAAKKTRNLKRIVSVLSVFSTLHFSYGLGYGIGIFNFLILRSKPSSMSKKSSR